MFFQNDKMSQKVNLPLPQDALPGRATQIPTASTHFVTGRPLRGALPGGLEVAYFGMGCFWGVERLFWQIPGVWLTAAGYQGGITPNPTYPETCTGLTGHAETVMVVFDPEAISYRDLLKVFWESHDPTQGMRQGNDIGTTYRSAIYTTSDLQTAEAESSRDAYEKALQSAGRGGITTEIAPAGEFYFAEAEHQQYLAKNPNGYCGLKGTGVSCAIPIAG